MSWIAYYVEVSSRQQLEELASRRSVASRAPVARRPAGVWRRWARRGRPAAGVSAAVPCRRAAAVAEGC